MPTTDRVPLIEGIKFGCVGCGVINKMEAQWNTYTQSLLLFLKQLFTNTWLDCALFHSYACLLFQKDFHVFFSPVFLYSDCKWCGYIILPWWKCKLVCVTKYNIILPVEYLLIGNTLGLVNMLVWVHLCRFILVQAMWIQKSMCGT